MCLHYEVLLHILLSYLLTSNCADFSRNISPLNSFNLTRFVQGSRNADFDGVSPSLYADILNTSSPERVSFGDVRQGLPCPDRALAHRPRRTAAPTSGSGPRKRCCRDLAPSWSSRALAPRDTLSQRHTHSHASRLAGHRAPSCSGPRTLSARPRVFRAVAADSRTARAPTRDN